MSSWRTKPRRIWPMLIAIGLVSAICVGFYFHKRYDYFHIALYPGLNFTLEGKYIDGILEFNRVTADLAIYDINNPKPPVPTSCDLVLLHGNASFNVARLNPQIIEGLGAHSAPGGGTPSFWGIESSEGVNPSYYLTCSFYNDQIILFEFDIRNPPDSQMGPTTPRPFSFSLKGKTFSLPISEKDLLALIGPPSSYRTRRMWP